MKINFDKLVLGDTAELQEMEIVQGLRILVRLGDRARRALAAIEQGKEFNESFPYIRIPKGYRNPGLNDAHLDSCPGIVHRQGVTRKDFPGYKYMKLVLGSTHESSYAGSRFREFTVKVKSRIIYVGENKNRKVIVRNLRSQESIIGYVRIKKNGAATFKSSRGIPVYKLYRYQNVAEDSIFKFAKDVTYHLILNSTYERKPTKIIELEQKLSNWIAEDYVFKWFNEMLDHAKSITTVETVMDS